MDKRRAAPINNVQKEMLIEFMASHPDLQTGKFSATFTFKKAQQLWENISITLNSVAGGATKDWRQWRKTWQDIKKNTKAKASKEKRHANQTGGGEPLKSDFDGHELKVLDMLSSTAVSGLQNVEESPIDFDLEEGTLNEGFHTMSAYLEQEEEEDEQIIVLYPTVGGKENCFEQGKEETDSSNMPACIPVPQTSSVKTPQLKTLQPKTPKLTRIRRLENSLKLSDKLVKGIDKKCDIVQSYYETKKKYIEHKMKYETQKLKTLQEQNQILSNIEKSVSCYLKK